MQFYALNYSLRQRMDILDVSAQALPSPIRAALAGMEVTGQAFARIFVEGPEASPAPCPWRERLGPAPVRENHFRADLPRPSPSFPSKMRANGPWGQGKGSACLGSTWKGGLGSLFGG